MIKHGKSGQPNSHLHPPSDSSNGEKKDDDGSTDVSERKKRREHNRSYYSSPFASAQHPLTPEERILQFTDQLAIAGLKASLETLDMMDVTLKAEGIEQGQQLFKDQRDPTAAKQIAKKTGTLDKVSGEHATILAQKVKTAISTAFKSGFKDGLITQKFLQKNVYILVTFKRALDFFSDEAVQKWADAINDDDNIQTSLAGVQRKVINFYRVFFTQLEDQLPNLLIDGSNPPSSPDRQSQKPSIVLSNERECYLLKIFLRTIENNIFRTLHETDKKTYKKVKPKEVIKEIALELKDKGKNIESVIETVVDIIPISQLPPPPPPKPAAVIVSPAKPGHPWRWLLLGCLIIGAAVAINLIPFLGQGICGFLTINAEHLLWITMVVAGLGGWSTLYALQKLIPAGTSRWWQENKETIKKWGWGIVGVLLLAAALVVNFVPTPALSQIVAGFLTVQAYACLCIAFSAVSSGCLFLLFRYKPPVKNLPLEAPGDLPPNGNNPVPPNLVNAGENSHKEPENTNDGDTNEDGDDYVFPDEFNDGRGEGEPLESLEEKDNHLPSGAPDDGEVSVHSEESAPEGVDGRAWRQSREYSYSQDKGKARIHHHRAESRTPSDRPASQPKRPDSNPHPLPRTGPYP